MEKFPIIRIRKYKNPGRIFMDGKIPSSTRSLSRLRISFGVADLNETELAEGILAAPVGNRFCDPEVDSKTVSDRFSEFATSTPPVTRINLSLIDRSSAVLQIYLALQ